MPVPLWENNVLDKYLDQLSSDLELEPFDKKKDNQGFYTVRLADDICLYMKDLFPGLMMTSQLIECPESKREVLFIYLMKANFLGLSTGGSAIGLDKNEKYLTLSRIITYDINYKSFKEIIEDFANYLDLWRQEVKRHQQAAEEGIL
ncbi:MAG: type III secretion system chaperone [Chlamydiae bacterium]|nr:type III secretion system chaperone [Chlamydiota bacterium]